MKKSCLMAMIIAGAALAAPVAGAQPPESGDARFTFHRADDGYLRLDGRTGEVAMCHRRSSGWQCQLVPDERSALEGELARVQAENAALRKELSTRSLPLPHGMRPDAPVPEAQRPQFPDDAELNRIIGFIEKVWRRMIEMMGSVQRDLNKRI